MDAVLTPQITVDDILAALRRVPPQRLADIFQYIEFIEYQEAQAVADASEDEALWAAVEANDAYKQQHLNEEPERYKTGADFLKAVADL